jgi:hypothetical protein
MALAQFLEIYSRGILHGMSQGGELLGYLAILNSRLIRPLHPRCACKERSKPVSNMISPSKYSILGARLNIEDTRTWQSTEKSQGGELLGFLVIPSISDIASLVRMQDKIKI